MEPGDGYDGSAVSVTGCLKGCCEGSKHMTELYFQERRYSQQSRVAPSSGRVLRKETTPNSFPGPSEGWALVGARSAERWAVTWAGPALLCYVGLTAETC